MGKFKIFSLGFSLCLAFSTFSAKGFDGPTHSYVTKTSLSIIHNLGVAKRNKNHSEDAQLSSSDDVIIHDDFYNSENEKIILEYCIKPDKDETDGGFKWHFYNPATEFNFMGEKESALTKFLNHYNAAKVNYKSGYYGEAFQEFGRSIHFIEDLNTPVHTNYENFMDAGLKLSMHVEFESRCVAVQESCVAKVSEQNLRYCLDNTKKIYGKSCAYLAADLFYSLENKLMAQDEVAQCAVLNAQRSVVGLLNRFPSDVLIASNKNLDLDIDEELAKNTLNRSTKNI